MTEVHLLSSDIKIEIIVLKRQDLSNKEVARRCRQLFNRPTISHQTVRYVWEKYQNSGEIGNQWSDHGRPTKLTIEMRNRILEYCIANRKAASREYIPALNLNVSSQLVRKVLIDNGYKACRAKKKILISEANKTKRVEFARDMLNNNREIFRDIVYSDESRFNLFNSDGRVLVRRRPGEAFNEDCIQYRTSVTNQIGIMVWGCISVIGPGPLIRVEGNENGEKYLEMISFNLGKWYPKLFEDEDSLYFMHDKAGAHRANIVTNAIEASGLNILVFPAQSPDFNLIEAVWNWIDIKIKGKVFDTQDEIWQCVKNLWYSIPNEIINNLYRSIPRRFQAAIDSNGGPTRY
jgi:hypothetical protein